MSSKSLTAALLLLLSASVAGAQTVAGDFSIAAGIGSPYVFGGDDGFFSQSTGQALVNSGVTFSRAVGDYFLTDFAPNTTLSAYQGALAAGCPSGSVCDPGTWNWSARATEIPLAHSMGVKTMGIMSYDAAFDAQYATSPPGRAPPSDLNAWADMVKKVYVHQSAVTRPDYIEIWNEPDCCVWFTGMTEYHAMYKAASAAIRSVDPTVAIAGPVISIANSAWVADLFDGTIPLNDINLITFHAYQDAYAEDGSMLGAARAHGVGAGITEWNADSNCVASTLDNNDPVSVAFVGQRLIDQLNAGFTVSSLFALGTAPNNCTVWTDASMTTLLPKMRAFLLMSKKMGLGAGPSSLRQITGLGFASAALAAVNSAGNPVMVFANHGGSSIPVTATFSNTGLSGTVGLQTFLADFGANTAQSPIDNVNVTASGGSISHMFTMTPYSIAGVILGAVIAATPTPSGATPTPTATPAAGCAVTITSPVNGATVSGAVPVTVAESGCGVNNRLSISGPGASNHFDYQGNSFSWDTTQWPNEALTMDVSAWDSSFTGQLADSAPVIVTVANGVPTATATATPKPTATATIKPTSTASSTVTASATPTKTPAPTSTPTPNTPIVGIICPTGFQCVFTPAASCPTPGPTSVASSTPTVGPTPAPVPTPGALVRTSDFLHSLGVVTHDIQTAETKAQIIAGFQYLGIPNGRDDATHNTSGVGSVQDLCDIHAATGVLYDELPIVDSDPNNIADTKAEWDQLAGCGAMLQAEGPNEPNNFPFTYQGAVCGGSGAGSFLPCARFQADMYQMVKADPLLQGFPVLGISEIGAEQDNTGAQFLTVPSGQFTELPAGTVVADVANAHNYAVGNGGATAPLLDNQPRLAGSIARIGARQWDACGNYWGNTWRNSFPTIIQCEATGSQNAIRKQTTETGMVVNSAVSADAQGRLLTDVYLDAYQLNWEHTFIYLMFQEPSSLGYGMLNMDGTPTLLGTYIHNLTTILADASSAFTPTPIAVTVSGLPATGYSQLMQKSTGKYELVVWGEAFASETATPVTVGLPSSRPVNVYDITSGTAPTQTLTTNSVPLSLTDHAMVVEF